jgi:hypothetical protein
MCSLLHDPALIKDNNLIAEPAGRKPVTYVNRCPVSYDLIAYA